MTLLLTLVLGWSSASAMCAADVSDLRQQRFSAILDELDSYGLHALTQPVRNQQIDIIYPQDARFSSAMRDLSIRTFSRRPALVIRRLEWEDDLGRQRTIRKIAELLGRSEMYDARLNEKDNVQAALSALALKIPEAYARPSRRRVLAVPASVILLALGSGYFAYTHPDQVRRLGIPLPGAPTQILLDSDNQPIAADRLTQLIEERRALEAQLAEEKGLVTKRPVQERIDALQARINEMDRRYPFLRHEIERR